MWKLCLFFIFCDHTQGVTQSPSNFVLMSCDTSMLDDLFCWLFSNICLALLLLCISLASMIVIWGMQIYSCVKKINRKEADLVHFIVGWISVAWIRPRKFFSLIRLTFRSSLWWIFLWMHMLTSEKYFLWSILSNTTHDWPRNH